MFLVKVHNPNRDSDADFFVQSKGDNAGKPLRVSSSNCFEVKVTDTDILLPEYLYFMVMNAYNHGAFKKYIKGSVIPYITIEDFYSGFLEFYGHPL